MSNSVNPANRAAFALQNLGRVASDAPFGFIAIQNNLDPLFDSFRRLQADTGSSAAAFQALKASLIGPAGIALAFTAVSSLVTVAIQKYGSLSNALSALNPFVTNAQLSQLAFNKALVAGANAAAEDQAKLSLLFAAVKDLNVSEKDRKDITDELIKQYPKTFSGLTAEAIAAGKADKAYKELAKSLLAKAAVQAGTDAIAKQGAEMLKLRLESDDLNKQLKELQTTGNKTTWSHPFGADPVSLAKQIDAIQNKLYTNQRKQNDLTEQATAIQKQQLAIVEQFGTAALDIKSGNVKQVSQVVKELTETLSNLDQKAKLSGTSVKDLAQEKIRVLNKAFSDIQKAGGPETEAALTKVGAQIKALGGDITSFKDDLTKAKVFKTLTAELAAVDAQAAATGLSFDNVAKQKVTALQKAFENLVKLGVKPGSNELQKIADQIATQSNKILGSTDIIGNYRQALGKQIKTVRTTQLTQDEVAQILGLGNIESALASPFKAPIRVQPVIDIQTAPALNTSFSDAQAQFNARIAAFKDSLSKQVNTFTKEVNTLIQSTASDGIVSLADSVGAALVSGNINSVLGGFVDLISGFLAQLGKLLVIQGVAIEAFKTSLSSLQGVTAIAAGAALIAASAAFKSLAGKGLNAYATGGVALGPQLAVIGDNPGRKEAVIPSEMFDKLGSNNDLRLTATLKGSDLLIAVQRAGREFNRYN